MLRWAGGAASLAEACPLLLTASGTCIHVVHHSEMNLFQASEPNGTVATHDTKTAEHEIPPALTGCLGRDLAEITESQTEHCRLTEANMYEWTTRFMAARCCSALAARTSVVASHRGFISGAQVEGCGSKGKRNRPRHFLAQNITTESKKRLLCANLEE